MAAGTPVTVGGLEVCPGDLLHGDKHGVTSIPPDAARHVPQVAAQVEAGERRIIEFCQSSEFDTDTLWKMLTGGRG